MVEMDTKQFNMKIQNLPEEVEENSDLRLFSPRNNKSFQTGNYQTPKTKEAKRHPSDTFEHKKLGKGAF